MAIGSEAYGPYTQYLQRVGLGEGYWNPAQRYLAGMYNPIRSLWETQQPIGVATGAGTPGWEDYMGQMGGGMGPVRAQAATTLQQLLGLTPARRGEMGLGYEPAYDPLTGAASYEGQGLGSLQDLMTLGLANRFGQMGAGYAASRLPQMQQQWQLGQAGGQPGTSFLDYIRAKYGI